MWQKQVCYLQRTLHLFNAGSTSITTTDVTLNSKLVSTYSKLVKSDKVIRNVISNLSLNMDEDVLKNSVSVTATEDTEFY